MAAEYGSSLISVGLYRRRPVSSEIKIWYAKRPVKGASRASRKRLATSARVEDVSQGDILPYQNEVFRGTVDVVALEFHNAELLFHLPS